MRLIVFAGLLSTSCGLLTAADTSALSGGATTIFDTGRNAFSHPLANITPLTRRQHVTGNSFFNENWVAAPASTGARDGLGPMFNARSCSACHPLDGRGSPDGVALLVRISIMHDGKAAPHPIYGDQIQPLALPGAQAEASIRLRWADAASTYPDHTTVMLRRPVLELDSWRDGKPEPLMLSPRVGNAVFGLGLLEAVPEATVRALADPDDRDGDGISGRPNEIRGADGQIQLGRFGWKANQPTLRQQAADAFAGDIGITSPAHLEENHSSAQTSRLADFPSGGTPELEELLLQRVTTYLQTLAPPARRNVKAEDVQRGQQLFHKARCNACHLHELRTGDSHPVQELRGQIIHPYTDLLLHDMGAGLADNRPDHTASGTEWRTPPLWGLGLQKTVNGHTSLLHDGRARNSEEAILWHDGEADASRQTFRKMSATERADLLTFLDSL